MLESKQAAKKKGRNASEVEMVRTGDSGAFAPGAAAEAADGFAQPKGV